MQAFCSRPTGDAETAGTDKAGGSHEEEEEGFFSTGWGPTREAPPPTAPHSRASHFPGSALS